MIVVLLGAPGAGKGTQAKKLVDEYGFIHISTGDLLRAAVAEGSDLGKKAKKYMDAGDLVPDDLIIDLVIEVLTANEDAAGILLDGFPRSSTQAVALDTELANRDEKVDVAIAIDVDNEEVIKRLSSRYTCRSCGHIDTYQESCPKCSGEMYQRDDDKPETIKHRLETYEKVTTPLLDYYEGQGKLAHVSGTQPVDDVYKEIKEVLELD